MATELAKAYVQILPSTEGIKSKLTSALKGDVSEAGDSAGKTMGGSLVGAIKGVVAAAGIGTFIKSTLDAGGAIQQSFGGLDTIYGSASEAAKKYAVEAAKAGISANDYAEQAVSFGAALKMAFSGDTTKAVEAANTAILDMTDNAAKMGTPLESIQNAYQGFAKQNYTMLDNLKLGYGGTKNEMERLLADAEKLSGVHYNIENLGEVYEAIHVIQKELGLTGVAAAEAADTFTGSMGAMKAAFQNMMASMALGENIYEPFQVFAGNLKVFLNNNLIPMLRNVLMGTRQLIANVIYEIGATLSEYSKSMPNLVDFTANFIESLVSSFGQNAGKLTKGVYDVISSFITAVINYNWSAFANDFITEIKADISESAYALFGDYDANIVQTLLNNITKALPKVLDVGGSIITNLISGIAGALPGIITTIANIVPVILNFITTNVPVIFSKVQEIAKNIIKTVGAQIPAIIEAIAKVIPQLLSFIKTNVPIIIDNVVKIIGNVIKAVRENIPVIIDAISTIISKVIGFITENAPAILESIGNVFGKIVSFIGTVIPIIVEKIGEIGAAVFEYLSENLPSIIENIKEFFGNLISTISENLPGIIETISGIFEQIIGYVTENLPTFIENTKSFIGEIITAIGEKIPEIVEKIGEIIPKIAEFIAEKRGELLEKGSEILGNIIDGISEKLPDIVAKGGEILSELASGMVEYYTNLFEKGSEILSKIIEGISAAFPTIVDTAASIIDELATDISDNLPTILESGEKVLNALVDGILQAIPKLLSTGGETLISLDEKILENLPAILETGKDILLNLVKGIVENFPEFVNAIIDLIGEWTDTIADNLPEILETGITIIGELVAGLIKAIPDVIEGIGEIIDNITESFDDVDWIDVGKNIIEGIIKGLKKAGGAIWDAITDVCGEALDAAKDFFGIHSPSTLMRDQIGRFIPEGMAVGIEKNVSAVTDAMDELADKTSKEISGKSIGFSSFDNATVTSSNMYTVNSKSDENNDILNVLLEYLPQLANMQIVTDTGAMVGALAPGMDNALGKLATRRGRTA